MKFLKIAIVFIFLFCINFTCVYAIDMYLNDTSNNVDTVEPSNTVSNSASHKTTIVTSREATADTSLTVSDIINIILIAIGIVIILLAVAILIRNK